MVIALAVEVITSGEKYVSDFGYLVNEILIEFIC